VWGPSHPLFIVAQTFEPSPTRENENFMLSFTNEFDPFDVTHDSFEIVPGYQHTFRIIPSQLMTTPAFDKLSVNDRGCRLKNENNNSSLFKSYSKTNCEFECIMKAASNACKCLPWAMPRMQSKLKTCDMIGNSCFRNVFHQSKLYRSCNCMPDCQTTTFSISESTRPFIWKKCDSIDNLVTMVQQRYSLYFALENVKNEYGSNVASYHDICGHLKDNHISIIKVEMGTKSVIKSVRDVKASFEYQLSAVGETFFIKNLFNLFMCL